MCPPDSENAIRPPPDLRHGERGLTLTELTVVGALATVVMLALTAFYFNSQRVWIDGSTQALAQRDGTMLVEEIRYWVHEAQTANVTTTDPTHDQLTLTHPAYTIDFRWHSSDQRVHLHDTRYSPPDRGPVVETPVTRISFTTRGAEMVDLTLLELRTVNGDTVRTASSFALLGR